VYRRADLSRTVMLVVALLLTAISTGVFAREFRAAGAAGLNPVNAAWIGTLRDGVAQPIEQIRKVE